MSDPDPPLRDGFALALIVTVVLVIGWSMLPMLSGGGPSKTMGIVNNLRRIEIMKEMWASDHTNVTGRVQVTQQDLAPYSYGYSSNGLVKPVIGERYIIHRLGVGPEAQLTRAYRKLPAQTLIRLRPETNRLFRIILPNDPLQATAAQPRD